MHLGTHDVSDPLWQMVCHSINKVMVLMNKQSDDRYWQQNTMSSA